MTDYPVNTFCQKIKLFLYMKKPLDNVFRPWYKGNVSKAIFADEAQASLFDNLEMKMNLKDLRARAATIGIRIEAERFDVPVGGNFWGYWLIDEKTNDGVWDDENYCSDHQELSQALRQLEFKRGVRCKAMMPF